MSDPEGPPTADTPLPMVSRPSAPAHPATGTPPPGAPRAAPAGRALQRSASGAVTMGVPVTTTSTRAPVQRSEAPAAPAGSGGGTGTAGNRATARSDGIDTEELARRLLDPLSRLLRADLRRGRERAGRLYDDRR
ncbi:hypothetical protein [Streptomyces albireticuli]|uniref:hypothetical protein n=1 Tax=Streptomyces albireticuli TaxID=1940 RepID=UPI003691FD57